MVTSWSIEDVMTSDSKADCGPVTVDFFMEQDYVPLDETIFTDSRDTHPHQLIIKEIHDSSKVGEYRIKYRTFYSLYPGNAAEPTQPFIVTVTDPCSSNVVSI